MRHVAGEGLGLVVVPWCLHLSAAAVRLIACDGVGMSGHAQGVISRLLYVGCVKASGIRGVIWWAGGTPSWRPRSCAAWARPLDWPVTGPSITALSER